MAVTLSKLAQILLSFTFSQIEPVPQLLFFLRYIYFTLTCISVLLACMSVHHIHAWCLLRSKEGIGSPGSEITDGCELLCGYWDLNLDSLQEQVLLINC